MYATSVIALALSATGLAQVVVPAGYNKVYLQSLVDTTFVVQAKGLTSGSTVVVYVSDPWALNKRMDMLIQFGMAGIK